MNLAPMSARWLLTLFAATSTLCACGAGGGPSDYVPDAAEGQDEWKLGVERQRRIRR